MTYKLFCGNCLDILPELGSQSVNLILADLPFSTKKRRVTDLKWDSPINLDVLWREYKRILKPNGVVVLHGINPFASSLIQSNPSWFKYDYIWIKSQAANFQLAKKMPLKKHEQLLVFYSGRPTYNPQMWKGKPKQKRIGKETYGKRKSETYINTKMVNLSSILSNIYYPTTILNFPSVPRNKSLHRTQKPVELEEFIIRTYSNKGDIVLDNVMGSGTTIIASERNERNSIGIELDMGIFEIARKRIEGEAKEYL